MKGMLIKKMYFEDDEYKKFLEDIKTLLNDKNEFYKMYIKVNNLENEFLKEQLEMYTPFNEQESIDKQTFLTFINTFDDVLTRKNIFGHLTASAFVVNEDFTKSLMVNHNIFGGFIYLGGHADGEFDLLSVAIREVEEETGLKVIPLINGDIFALQALPIKGHVKKGKYVSAHIHYDVLYLLLAKNSDMNNIRILESENSRGGVIAPGVEGYYTITIDASDVDVPFECTIRSEVSPDSSVSDLKTLSYEINPTDTENRLTYSEDTGIVQEIPRNTQEYVFRIYLVWDDDTGNMDNQADTEVGIDDNSKALMQVSLHFTQLNE